MTTLRLYSPITDINTTQVFLYYSSTFYELLRPDSQRKGHVTKNSGKVPIIVSFGFELTGIYPPYPVSFTLTLQPGDFYLGDVPELIPVAAKWLYESDSFGLGELTISELF